MKFRFHQRHQKEAKRYFCKTRKEMHLTSGSSSQDTSCYVGPGSENTLNLGWYPDYPKGKWDELANMLRMCILNRSIQS